MKDEKDHVNSSDFVNIEMCNKCDNVSNLLWNALKNFISITYLEREFGDSETLDSGYGSDVAAENEDIDREFVHESDFRSGI